MAIDIVVPEVGESIVDARVARWLKKEGDPVAAGEPLVELETDKIDVEVSAPKAGVLERIAHRDGDDVRIGEVIGTIKEGPAGSIAPTGPAGPTAPAKSTASSSATPSARKLAREQNVELGAVKSDGPRVTRDDVEKAASKPSEVGRASCRERVSSVV